jgi:hypothetical protein
MRVDPKGNPYVNGFSAFRGESRRKFRGPAQNANHSGGFAAQNDLFADDPRIAAERPPPKRTAQDDDIRAFGAIFFWSKGSAEGNLLAEEMEVGGSDKCRPDLLGTIATGHADPAESVGGDVLQGGGLLAPKIEFHWRG